MRECQCQCHRSQRRQRLKLEAAAKYTGYAEDKELLRNAFHRGELKAERPFGGDRGRLFFDPDELDRWLATIKVSAKAAGQ